MSDNIDSSSLLIENSMQSPILLYGSIAKKQKYYELCSLSSSKIDGHFAVDDLRHLNGTVSSQLTIGDQNFFGEFNWKLMEYRSRSTQIDCRIQLSKNLYSFHFVKFIGDFYYQNQVASIQFVESREMRFLSINTDGATINFPMRQKVSGIFSVFAHIKALISKKEIAEKYIDRISSHNCDGEVYLAFLTIRALIYGDEFDSAG